MAWNANGRSYSSHKLYLRKYSNVCYCQSALSPIMMARSSLISNEKLPNTLRKKAKREKQQQMDKNKRHTIFLTQQQQHELQRNATD